MVAANLNVRKDIYSHKEQAIRVSFLIATNKLPYFGRVGDTDYYDVNGIVWEVWQRSCGNHPTTNGILTANFKPTPKI